jgi:hypothetical protein
MLEIFLFIYSVLEFTNLQRQIHTYNYFNELYVEPIVSEMDKKNCIDALISKDSEIFERSKLYTITNQIMDIGKLYNAVTCIKGENTPSDIMQVGTSRLHWSYTPVIIDICMKQLRILGEYYMYWNGYSRKTYITKDGYYSVFTYKNNTNKSKPLIFFPGIGFGAIPYAHVAKLFRRTIHIVEVPNLCYATPNTNSHATGTTLSEVVKSCVDEQEHDVICHSFGSFHTSIYLNTSYKLNKIKNVVICEGFTNPIDVVYNHILPFISCKHFGHIPIISKSFLKYMIFTKVLVNNIYIHSYCKRYIDICTNVNWRDYGDIKIKYVYSENDELLNSKYITSKMNPEDYYFIPKGRHGACFFGKKRNTVIENIIKMLQ